MNDTKYFFGSGSYYKKRITKLIQEGFLKRTKLKLVLEDNAWNREKLKYLHSVDWARMVEDL